MVTEENDVEFISTLVLIQWKELPNLTQLGNCGKWRRV